MIKKINSIFLLLVIFVLSSCTKTTALTNQVTTSASTSASIFTIEPSTGTLITYNITKEEKYYSLMDLKYGQDEEQIYDIYLPLDYQEKEDCKCFFFIHGGAWIDGVYRTNYLDFPSYMDYLVDELNLVVINMEYHLCKYNGLNSTSVNTMLDDIGYCIEDTKNVLNSLNLSASSMCLSGHSAGGHLALLYSYKVKEAAIPIKAVCSLSGPTDLTTQHYLDMINNRDSLLRIMSEEQVTYFVRNLTEASSKEEGIAKLDQFSPIYFVDNNTIPTIIFHGDEDETVLYSDSTKLIEKLNKSQVDSLLVTLTGCGHINTCMTKYLKLYFNDSLKSFLELHL